MAEQPVQCCAYHKDINEIFLRHGYTFVDSVRNTCLVNNSKGRRVASITGSTITDRSSGELLEDSALVEDLSDAGYKISQTHS